MKELTKIKLINWHYFTNETIEIQGSMLLTGDNGSGKSTILDAIQYVLVADMRKVRFNVSAHDETKRDLLGYLRCKTGSDAEGGQRTLRQGDISSYVVLEFTDRHKGSALVLGAALDSYADQLNYESRFFKLDNTPLTDELFIAGGRPRNIRDFRKHVKGELGSRATVYNNSDEYRSDLRQALGGFNERFFSLFVKAISFKPITNIRQFVYDYVLDERRVQIEVMKENLYRYREFEELAADVRAKLIKLEQIKTRHEELVAERVRTQVTDQIIIRAGLEQAEQELQRNEAQQVREQAELTRLQGELQATEQEAQQAEQHYITLKAALSTDQSFILLKRLEQEIAELEPKEHHLKQLLQELHDLALNQRGNLERLGAGARVSQGIERGQLDELLAALRQLSDQPSEVDDPLRQHLERGDARIAELHQQLWQAEREANQRRDQLLAEQRELEQALNNLRRGRHDYEQAVKDLRTVISERFWDEKGIELTPQVLCELLEVPNERWQNAVEGYLNTQRFDLIVPPQHFDFALSIYERFKQERRISGVGLVNTARLMSRPVEVDRGSLAEEVVCADPAARAYANWLMGRVIKCENEQQLKRFPRSITPTCMTYQNHVARQIKFEVYATPYIGARALARQIAMKEARLHELRQELASVSELLTELTGAMERINTWRKQFERMRLLWGSGEEWQLINRQLAQKRKEKASIDLTDLRTKEAELEQVGQRRQQLQAAIRSCERQSGALTRSLETLQSAQPGLRYRLSRAEEELEVAKRAYPDATVLAEERYHKERRQRAVIDILESFSSHRKAQETIIGKRLAALTELRASYNTAYHFGGRTEGDGIEDYQQELEKLSASTLPDYEEKIQSAKRSAEQEFKEHFIYKLKENIESARTEFGYLNQALQTIQFGEDRYSFWYGPSSEYKHFYDMIMDTERVSDELSLFDDHFAERHRQAMDELFDRVLTSSTDAVDESLQRFTDYRTFLDYDIKIHHKSGETSLYSKVFREKSGGETQTPYYVAIVASFLQTYRLTTNRQKSIALMMFDEAFNRMDSERIENSLRFIRSLGMQVIIAAPTDKCEYITPHVQTTLLVMREGHESWIEDYKRLKEMVG